jgi:hypothetical protein
MEASHPRRTLSPFSPPLSRRPLMSPFPDTPLLSPQLAFVRVVNDRH